MNRFLVAIAAIMGAYYGGQAFQNGQINATASTIISEAQQILQAARIWSTYNNQPDISGTGAIGTSGSGMSALVKGKELAEWPPLGGSLGVSASLTNPGPQPTGGGSTTTTGSYDNGCFSMNGSVGSFLRFMFSYNSQNYVTYFWQANISNLSPCASGSGSFTSSTTDVSQINHPIVKIAKAINAALNQIPANAALTRMPYIGLPFVPVGSIRPTNTYDTSGYWAGSTGVIYLDPTGTTIESNYCYVFGSQTLIVCVFGPS